MSIKAELNNAREKSEVYQATLFREAGPQWEVWLFNGRKTVKGLFWRGLSHYTPKLRLI